MKRAHIQSKVVPAYIAETVENGYYDALEGRFDPPQSVDQHWYLMGHEIANKITTTTTEGVSP